MWAAHPGAHSCSARTIIATDLVGGNSRAFSAKHSLTIAPLLLAVGILYAILTPEAAQGQEWQENTGAGETAGSTSEIARLHRTAAEISPHPLPALASLRARCHSDVLCAAKILAESLAPHGRLQRVATPSSDAIRGVAKQPSLETGAVNEQGWMSLRLHRFGRDVMWELRAALNAARKDQGIKGITLDLRANTGGDFDRMLRVAGLFCGQVENAVRLHAKDGQRSFSIPEGAPLWTGGLRVLIGAQTASGAEVLAALLRRYSGARLLGERSFGKDVLLREIAVRHGWRLLLPAGRLEVDGVELSAGLMPDADAPAERCQGVRSRCSARGPDDTIP